MTTKQQLQEQLARLEAAHNEETAKLRKQIEAMQDDKPNANNPHVFAPDRKERFEALNHNTQNGQFVTRLFPYANNNGKVKHAFRTHQAADDWADMLDVMMELRVCEGACEFRNEDCYSIVIDCVGGSLIPIGVDIYCLERATLSGCFDTRENAKKAIATVGKERILKAFRTAAGVIN